MIGNQHNEYVFEVELLASVRVRATSGSDAREMIPAALEAPGADVIRLANETNFIAGRNAIVTEVTFFTEEGVFRLVEVRARCYGDDSFSSLHADYAAA